MGQWHPLDPLLVVQSVLRMVRYNEEQRKRETAQEEEALVRYTADIAAHKGHLWRRKPDPVGVERNRCYDSQNKTESAYYSHARVWETDNGEFLLCYPSLHGGHEDTVPLDGTGPFATFDAAAAWFYNGGR